MVVFLLLLLLTLVLLYSTIVQYCIRIRSYSQGRRQGGFGWFRRTPLSEAEIFFKLKITPNLTALELSGSYVLCPLVLLCATLQGHITLMLNHCKSYRLNHVINCTRDARLKMARVKWRRTVQWLVETYYYKAAAAKLEWLCYTCVRLA